ncbi:hypothetical protein MMC17_009062 [Xylographa soralifera]|nr:hypothetical protein [Xylographa soralifera]
MTSQQPTSRLAASSASHVRRNLFHHSLSRRPTSASTSTSATTLHDSPQESSNSEIVVRNQDGDYQVSVPSLPADEDEQAGNEDEKEAEKLDARIAHLCRNRNRQSSEPSELFVEVQASLRRRVAALEEDNWMFEAEKTSTG